MRLEDLPPELLRLVFESLDSPRSLYRLISTSASCFRVYKVAPAGILTPLIRKVYSEESLRHAIAVVQAYALQPISETLTYPDLLALLEAYFTDGPLGFPTKKEQLADLYRLRTRLSYFCNDYFTRTLSKIGESSPEGFQSFGDPENESSIHPSSTELLRLERAFLRYELYCKAFSSANYAMYAYLTEFRAMTQFNLFLSRIEPFEVEEMICIHQYLTFRVAEYVEEAEDYIVEELQTLSRTPPIFMDLKNEDGSAFLSRRRPTDWGPFGKRARLDMPGYINRMISHGLDFMYDFLRAEQPKRFELIWSNLWETREFLPEALVFAPRFDGPVFEPEDIEDDDPAHANLGFVLFQDSHRFRYPEILHAGIVRFPLRELGYVFWDIERIWTDRVGEALQRAHAMNWVVVRMRFDLTRRESAEERLEDVNVFGYQEHIERLLGLKK